MLVKKKVFCFSELGDDSIILAMGKCQKHFTELVREQLYKCQDTLNISDRDRILNQGNDISFDVNSIIYEDTISIVDIRVNNKDLIKVLDVQAEDDSIKYNYDGWVSFENRLRDVLDDSALFFKIIHIGNRDYYFYTM